MIGVPETVAAAFPGLQVPYVNQDHEVGRIFAYFAAKYSKIC
jgi:hypothetical protein